MEIEVIKFEPQDEAAHEIIAYRHPREDVSNQAQLLVAPSQVALFINEGEIHAFLPGHYTLDESNNSMFGFLQRWRTRLSNGVSAYHCTIYFINTSALQEMPFGSINPIEMNDPVEGAQIHVRYAGYFGARVNNVDKDGKDVIKFFVEVVKTAQSFTKKELAAYIKSRIIMHANAILGEVLVDKKISILDVAPKYVEISEAVQAKMAPIFAEYGILIEHFSFNTINAPAEDLQVVRERKEAVIKAKAAAEAMDIESEALARKRAREGYTYQQQEALAAMNKAAANEASTGQFMGMGMGLGMGLGMGPAMGNAMGGMMNQAMAPNAPQQADQPMMGQPQPAPAPQPAGRPCPSCGAMIPEGAKFCPGCGAAAPAPQPAVKVCPACGAQVPEGAKFCPSCGANMNAKKVCPQCGNELEPGAKFCPNCGQKIE